MFKNIYQLLLCLKFTLARNNIQRLYVIHHRILEELLHYLACKVLLKNLADFLLLVGLKNYFLELEIQLFSQNMSHS